MRENRAARDGWRRRIGLASSRNVTGQRRRGQVTQAVLLLASGIAEVRFTAAEKGGDVQSSSTSAGGWRGHEASGDRTSPGIGAGRQKCREATLRRPACSVQGTLMRTVPPDSSVTSNSQELTGSWSSPPRSKSRGKLSGLVITSKRDGPKTVTSKVNPLLSQQIPLIRPDSVKESTNPPLQCTSPPSSLITRRVMGCSHAQSPCCARKSVSPSLSRSTLHPGNAAQMAMASATASGFWCLITHLQSANARRMRARLVMPAVPAPSKSLTRCALAGRTLPTAPIQKENYLICRFQIFLPN